VRISEDRYARDLRRINLAQRLIQHNVRSQWIRAWTGFSEERVRNLYHSYIAGPKPKHRRRGPALRKAWLLVQKPLLHREASALAGLACLMRLIPREPLANARRALTGLSLGENLCRVFELYHRVVPGATFTMEQFILLVFALAERKELDLGRCESCNGVLVIDRFGSIRRRCPNCRLNPADLLVVAPVSSSRRSAQGIQQTLF